jgi:glutaredoxin
MSGHAGVRSHGRHAGRSDARQADRSTATVTVYSKPDCHLCEDAMLVLARLREELGFELRELDITADDVLHSAYFERIPVVALDGEELCDHFVAEELVRERLESRR